MATKTQRARLSVASPYEQLFNTRYRGRGRPADRDDEPLFPAEGIHPAVAGIARRRAYAVVHEEARDRLREVFRAEVRVLKRRELSEVARDAGVALSDDEGN